MTALLGAWEQSYKRHRHRKEKKWRSDQGDYDEKPEATANTINEQRKQHMLKGGKNNNHVTGNSGCPCDAASIRLAILWWAENDFQTPFAKWLKRAESMGKLLAKGAELAAKLLTLLSFWHPVCIYLYPVSLWGRETSIQLDMESSRLGT